jgi:flavin-dependent dehydrogenase
MKVGEATTEMSAMFLTRRLAQWEHLEREQLPKEGLRYWFSSDRVRSHADASEAGGALRSALPSFQLRRDALDEHLLATAVAEGAALRRPARVSDVRIGDFDHRVEIEQDGATETVACRWVIDASGRATFLGKRLDLIERNEAHPTGAMWCRWRDLRHIDDLAARGPASLHRGQIGSRRLSTNHYPGYGYWIWVIPLGNGETSVGVVFDRRLLPLHEHPDRAATFRRFLLELPLLAELLEGATMREDDFRFYAYLPYVSRQYAGPGWSLVGDAAAFLDPYYSPGLDHASFTAEATLELIKADRAGADVRARIAQHNEIFVRSYHRFFRAAYLDKYTYMGEFDLLSAAFLLDTAQYYLFVVIPAYRIYQRFHWMPVLGQQEAFFSYHFMTLYNRRLRRIALARRAAGEAGRRNHGRRLRAYFAFGAAPLRMLARGLRLWLTAELDLLRLRLSGRVPSHRMTAEPAATLPDPFSGSRPS